MCACRGGRLSRWPSKGVVECMHKLGAPACKWGTPRGRELVHPIRGRMARSCGRGSVGATNDRPLPMTQTPCGEISSPVARLVSKLARSAHSQELYRVPDGRRYCASIGSRCFPCLFPMVCGRSQSLVIGGHRGGTLYPPPRMVIARKH
jgi:hypothetical protein